MTNCPNCGAPVQGAVCVYCGTRFTLQPTAQEFIYTLYGEPIDVDEMLEELSRKGAMKISMDDRILFID